jgi:hypothetical protein
VGEPEHRERKGKEREEHFSFEKEGRCACSVPWTDCRTPSFVFEGNETSGAKDLIRTGVMMLAI